MALVHVQITVANYLVQQVPTGYRYWLPTEYRYYRGAGTRMQGFIQDLLFGCGYVGDVEKCKRVGGIKSKYKENSFLSKLYQFLKELGKQFVRSCNIDSGGGDQVVQGGPFFPHNICDHN